MSGYYRQSINGSTPRDIKITNDNFQQIWNKVFGDITFSDTNRTLQKQILTQWVPVQGEGNLDKTYPLYLRFFVPPEVEEIKSTNFNIIIENYRMDSSITSTTDSVQTGSSTTSSTAPQYSKTSSTAPSYTKTSSSAPQYSQTSTSSAVGGTSASGGGQTASVQRWGHGTKTFDAPSNELIYNGEMASVSGYYASYDYTRLAVPEAYIMYGGAQKNVTDMRKLQHQHDIPSHTHSVSLGSHSHSITVNSHTHDLTISSHTHDITIDSHKHDVQMQITVPGHNHSLDEGIKVTTTAPSGVTMYLNDVQVSNSLSGNGTSQLNIEVKDNVKIGTWNTIKITSSNIARATVYGTIELIIKR